jgi:hypothetical protein
VSVDGLVPARYIDGGAVLRAKPYEYAQWRPIRRAWWWHTVGMYFLVPYYPVVALTIWQRPSGQPVGRRVAWASVLTLSAVLVVGLPAFVVFSRRWYWLYRTQADPAAAGVPTERSYDKRGFFAWCATTGADLVDRLMRRFAARSAPPPALASAPRPAPPPAPPPAPLARPTSPASYTARPVQRPNPGFDEPWSSLVVEATRAVERIRQAAVRAQGPSVARIDDALREASVASETAWQVAARARDIEAALRSMHLDAMEHRLTALETSGGDPADVDAVRRSLAVQHESADRMRATVTRLLGQLERLVAQLCEAATSADELALGIRSSGDPAPGLTRAIDGLAAIRSALDTVEAAAS